MCDLATNHSLLQQVESPTHAVKLLDLVFTNNCELLRNTEVKNWALFSDHKLVIANTYFQLEKVSCDKKEQFLCDTGKRYNALNFHLAPWAELKAELSSIDWSNLEELAKSCPESALSEFHEKTLLVLEKLVPLKKKPRTKHKMHRMHRLLWKKHTKAQRIFKSAQSIPKVSENMQKMWKIEKQLYQDYTAMKNMEEDKAIQRIKANSKAFFSFARSKQNVKAKVGPFLDPSTDSPNSSPDFTAAALKKQYDSVFAPPRPTWVVSDTNSHFMVDGEEDSFSDFKFSPAHIEKACAELKSTAAPGPDGVPASLLKICRKELSKPLYNLWRSSLDTGAIPAELLLVMICPLYKGGSRAVPKNYRPVALTSHLIKVFERVLRWELVRHIERIGLLPDGQHGSRAMRCTLTQLLTHWDTRACHI